MHVMPRYDQRLEAALTTLKDGIQPHVPPATFEQFKTDLRAFLQLIAGKLNEAEAHLETLDASEANTSVRTTLVQNVRQRNIANVVFAFLLNAPLVASLL